MFVYRLLHKLLSHCLLRLSLRLPFCSRYCRSLGLRVWPVCLCLDPTLWRLVLCTDVLQGARRVAQLHPGNADSSAHLEIMDFDPKRY